ncbi:MAG: Methionine aminopeptidase [Candidatus Gottesmanbacteria bacterium GW2011_GWA2_44_17]|uniref:Methionine aminopeptidase n=3 Tax=Candidatus Gottesmaniibacteriota TaxID=1752720 RepID=A0A0G1KXZ4_9BACT|nr:MAG: Methionine aminopeptidase [Microgenomates group bacterium GW2011_GWC1_43_11]KKT38672.1 MAG: Methionine aminopeptidase [Candidatus Gottesmanbacteria bacterium GW2011_GWB1_44_11c]KKT47366.1 MAG: Methionine aminopeptidase [Candidatus Gottesmanbacteria bacterium GW2011_GWA2_44_17]KKT61167.1 MAG: Methionine aminopeptidase [Candidatus Gottesmanbacteria bacterium GW2011_GWA1_44_24b]HCM82428.1 type I methionyl aminopeptidase [Patescibacteria group bacterium]
MLIVRQKISTKTSFSLLVYKYDMILIKSPEEISIMKVGGGKLWTILQILLSQAKAGVSLTTIEKNARNSIQKAGGVPSFMTVKGYQWATCLCLNEQVVHGIPSAYILQEGDVLTIDVGMEYKGLHTDTAWTKIIQNSKFKIQNQEYKQKLRFLKTGEEVLKKAIGVAKAGNRVGHISQIIEQTITSFGYDVVQSLTGHGVGKKLHEEPMIPEYLDKPIEKTPLLTPGMTLAIEVIYAMGKGAIVYPNQDGWTLAAKDRSLTAVFEKTIAIEESETFVLTGS